jgi:hypothetical protein
LDDASGNWDVGVDGVHEVFSQHEGFGLALPAPVVFEAAFRDFGVFGHGVQVGCLGVVNMYL